MVNTSAVPKCSSVFIVVEDDGFLNGSSFIMFICGIQCNLVGGVTFHSHGNIMIILASQG